jgi:hypothetical protein
MRGRRREKGRAGGRERGEGALRWGCNLLVTAAATSVGVRVVCVWCGRGAGLTAAMIDVICVGQSGVSFACGGVAETPV